MSRVLVIGDTHIYFDRKGYREFCMDLYDQWDCNEVIHIGDVVDWHSISFHTKHPDGPGASDEYNRAKDSVALWHETFPKVKVCIGNHDERVVRLANSVQIPDELIKTYNEIWNTKGWDWQYSHVIDDVYYYHGTGQSGEYPASNAVKKLLMSVVMGHNHTASGSKSYANANKRVFACDTGCGIDDSKMAFHYGRHMQRRSIISAAVIIDGIPYIEPMPMAKGEKYWDGNFK